MRFASYCALVVGIISVLSFAGMFDFPQTAIALVILSAVLALVLGICSWRHTCGKIAIALALYSGVSVPQAMDALDAEAATAQADP